LFVLVIQFIDVVVEALARWKPERSILSATT